MSTTTAATATSSTVLPSATPSLTDSQTWVTIITSVLAVVSVFLHKDLSAYVPVASVLVAGAVTVALLVSKHFYAKALVAAGATASAGASVAPSNIASELHKAASVIQAVNDIQGTLKAAVAPTLVKDAQIAQTVAGTVAPVVTAIENPANATPVVTTS